jgi:hypothetical protein
MDPYFYVVDSVGKCWVVRRTDSQVICECTDSTRASMVVAALNATA